MDDENSASGEACMKMELDHSVDLTGSKRKSIDHDCDDDDDSGEEVEEEEEEEEEEEKEQEALFYDDHLWLRHWRWNPKLSKAPLPSDNCTKQVSLLRGEPPEPSCRNCTRVYIAGKERCDFFRVFTDGSIIELLGIRVWLPEKECTVALDDGKHFQIVYDGLVPRDSASACQEPHLEDYDHSVLLLDGPIIPTSLACGAGLFAAFRPRLGRMYPIIGSHTILERFGGIPVIVHQELRSKYGKREGSVDVGFIALNYAVVATVDIIFLPEVQSTIPCNEAVDLFGMINARYEVCEGDAPVFCAESFDELIWCELPEGSASSDPCLLSTLLFQKKKVEAVCLSPGDKIKLSRAMLCVPVHSYVVVKAQLFCALKQGTESNSYKSFVKGGAKFYPQCGGKSRSRISSEHGEIEVIISWNYNLWDM